MSKRYTVIRRNVPATSATIMKYIKGNKGNANKKKVDDYRNLGKHDSYDSLSDIGIPGMNKIFNRNYSLFGKVVWSIIILACFTFCVQQISRRVHHFMKVPYNTDVDLEREGSAWFPAVSICPFYPFAFNKKLRQLREDYKSLFPDNITDDENEYDFHFEDYFLQLLDVPHITATDLWQLGRINLSKEEVICQRLSTQRNCHLYVEKVDFATYLGICSRYQLSDRLKFDGPYNGMKLDLFDRENIDDLHYMVSVHHPDNDVTHSVYGNGGVYLPENCWTEIKFVTKKYLRVNTPARICLNRRDVQQCMTECIESHIRKNITCSLPYIRADLDLPECNTSDSAIRTYKHTLQVYEKMTTTDLLCQHCPKPCREYLYNGYDTVVDKVTNITRVSVLYYDNIAEIVREKTTYPFDVLLADIGGSMGLFLGICLLSILEFVEMLFVATKKKILGYYNCK